MKCPYSDPTIEQCLNCPLPECIPPEPSVEERRKLLARDASHRYYQHHKKCRLADTHKRNMKKKAASLRQQQSGTQEKSVQPL